MAEADQPRRRPVNLNEVYERVTEAQRIDKLPRLNLETVYRQTWPLIGRNAIALLILAVGIEWLANLVMVHAPIPRLTIGRWNWIAWLVRLATTLVSMITTVALSMCAAHIVLAKTNNPIASLAETAQAALPRLGGALIVALVLNGSSLIGWLTLLRFSPLFAASGARNWQSLITMTSGLAITVWAMWALSWVGLAAVVLIEEQTSGFRALQRAAFLARGQRWRLMAIYLPFAIILGLFIAALSFMIAENRTSLVAQFVRQWSGLALVEAISTVVVAALTAVAYRDLRKMKDGDRPDEIAAVFD